MQQLTNEEAAKVYAMYIGLACMCEDSIERISGFTVDKVESFGTSYAQLLLKPLSEISDEDAAICWENDNYIPDTQDIKHVSRLFVEMSAKQHQFLISRGYSVPLFFAPNHWANGKTPIELGIAIKSN